MTRRRRTGRGSRSSSPRATKGTPWMRPSPPCSPSIIPIGNSSRSMIAPRTTPARRSTPTPPANPACGSSMSEVCHQAGWAKPMRCISVRPERPANSSCSPMPISISARMSCAAPWPMPRRPTSTCWPPSRSCVGRGLRTPPFVATSVSEWTSHHSLTLVATIQTRRGSDLSSVGPAKEETPPYNNPVMRWACASTPSALRSPPGCVPGLSQTRDPVPTAASAPSA